MKESYPTKQGTSVLYKRSTSFYLLFICISLIILATVLKGMFFLGVLLLANVGLSLLTRLFKPYSFGIELNLLSAALAGMVYGPVTGALFGAISAIVHFIILGRMSLFTPLALIGYALTGFFASVFAGMSMASLGIVLSLLYILFISFPIIFVFRGSLGKCLFFGAVNIVFNFFLFSTLGEALLHAMSLY